jgi:hypothetical protein
MDVKLSKHIRFIIRVREYETCQVEVGAEISHFDIGYNDHDWAESNQRPRLIDQMRAALSIEVDRLAREELETVAEWSEISPNLAEDYLQTPAQTQRKHHATKTGSQSTKSGGLRRGAAPAAPSRPRPLRPA